MRSFWLGLAIGALLGGGGVYAALERPWQRAAPSAPATAGADAGSETDRPARRRRPRKRRRIAREAEAAAVELSARDRQLVWRGPSIELAPRAVDFAAEGGGRSLSPAEIDAGIAALADAITACIEDARGDADLTATIDLELLVEGDGRVSRVRVRAPRYLADRGLRGCIARATAGRPFAATGAQTIVSVPFHLR
ncbi:MAG: hypothetical protein D6689_07800 [Deltaproteobacteria bacterium]|nr:MAG: hypothetical protein D6689_07800 [Deltaproteobacteria bacterium]